MSESHNLLNGKPAKKFEIVISERQFQFSCEGKVFAESSSSSTLLKALSQMFELAGKPDVEFQYKAAPPPLIPKEPTVEKSNEI